jgi:hypothetical protein
MAANNNVDHIAQSAFHRSRRQRLSCPITADMNVIPPDGRCFVSERARVDVIEECGSRAIYVPHPKAAASFNKIAVQDSTTESPVLGMRRPPAELEQ